MSATEGPAEHGRRVYLDTASGEALHPAAREALAAALDAAYADPRRLHHAGRAARLVLDNARAATAEALGRPPRRGDLHVVGHRGGAPRPARAPSRRRAPRRHDRAHGRRALGGAAGRRLDAEPHPRGPRRRGRRGSSSTPSTLEDATVVACQSANHEVGTVQPVAELAARLDGVPLFVDACASAGPAAPPRRLVGARRVGPQVGRPRGRRHPGRTTRRAVARARSRRTTGPPSARAASRTCRRSWRPRRHSRPSWPSGTSRTRASTRWSTGSGPWWAASRTSRWSATRTTGCRTS